MSLKVLSPNIATVWDPGGKDSPNMNFRGNTIQSIAESSIFSLGLPFIYFFKSCVFF